MLAVGTCELPEESLLLRYHRDGVYTDCYFADVDNSVSQIEYIYAFYTTALFKLERVMLRWIASKPSTDDDALMLAQSRADTFAAWRVEEREENQLLLTDFRGQTRSWLMVRPFAGPEGTSTRLYFGSAVVPIRISDQGTQEGSLFMRLVLRFHWLYSRALLASARARLSR